MPIHYQIDGPSEAPVLMFSNSLGSDLSMWEPQIAPLSTRYRLLRYDTRGHGRSEVSPGPYTLDQLGRDVVKLLDDLRLPKVSFCGLSMGGLIGLWLGVNAPDRLNKLILANTGAKIGSDEAWNTRIAQVQASGMASVAEVMPERWLSAGFRHAHPEAEAAIRRMISAISPEGYVANCVAIRDADLRGNAASVRVPTLVITGLKDPSTPPELGRFLAAQIPGARLVELDSLHLSNVEKASEFNRAIESFLA